MRTLGLTLREIHLNFEKKNIKMVRKKIDNRIRVMIENGITLGHRTMFAVVGDKAKDQVVILHHMVRTLRTREGLVLQITIVLITDVNPNKISLSMNPLDVYIICQTTAP